MSSKAFASSDNFDLSTRRLNPNISAISFNLFSSSASCTPSSASLARVSASSRGTIHFSCELGVTLGSEGGSKPSSGDTSAEPPLSDSALLSSPSPISIRVPIVSM